MGKRNASVTPPST